MSTRTMSDDKLGFGEEDQGAAREPKVEIRARMKQALAAMSPQERHEASNEACARLLKLDAFAHASIVMLYMPLETEVDLTPVAIRCFQLAKTVCVPKVDWRRRVMHAAEIRAFDDRVMETDEHGIRTPRSGRPVLPDAIDLAIVPGLAFDTRGNRLGRGGGFYDRFLARLRRTATAVGLAYDVQIVDEVPTEEGDVAVDVVVTNRRVTTCGASRTA